MTPGEDNSPDGLSADNMHPTPEEITFEKGCRGHRGGAVSIKESASPRFWPVFRPGGADQMTSRIRHSASDHRERWRRIRRKAAAQARHNSRNVSLELFSDS